MWLVKKSDLPKNRKVMSVTDPNDRKLLEFLRQDGGRSVGELIEVMEVTATAVRQRLNRLMEKGYIERRLDRESEDAAGRGRPGYLYHITQLGMDSAGNNFSDLARVMWQEIQALEDEPIRNRLVQSLAKHLAEQYQEQLSSVNTSSEKSLEERMQEVIHLMSQRDVPLDMQQQNGLPVLNVLSCPYPALAEQDRLICDMETIMLSELLGKEVQLDECRLEGGRCCSFQPTSEPSTNGITANGEATAPPASN